VLLAKDGRVVVTDFGVARAASGDASRTGGAFIGTPAYMAPEQIEAPASVDHRADVYAFGAVLYEVLVGEIPFLGDTVLAIAAARLLRPPPDPRAKRADLPAAMAELVLRCMARAPDARPPSMPAIAATLASITVPMNPPVAPARSEVGAPLAASGRRVAVLPFANLGPEDQQYVADALTDDLIDALTGANGLRVRARGVVAKHATRDRDVRDVGRELGVDVVVEGSIRKIGAAFRVTARVVGVADGYQLWAKRFDVGEAELLVSCDVVAEAVAGALGATMPSAARRPAESPEAVDAYLRAREAHRRSFEKDRSRVVELFERARDLAPNDPRVLAGFASALLRSLPGPGMLKRARDAVDRAVAIAPSLPEVRLAAGQLASGEGDWVGCVTEFRRALRAAPGYGEAHDVLGRTLIEADDAHGIAHLETALAIDPGLDFARVGLARHAYLAGDAAAARALLEVAGRRVLLPAWCRFALWTRDAALARELRPLVSPDSPQLIVSGQMVDLILDGTPPAVRFAISPDVPLPLTTRLFFGQLETEISSFMGDTAHALGALTSADANGLPDVAWMRRCPLLDPLRGEPAFGDVLAHVEARGRAIGAAYLTPER
jgi:serine/threonine-protein kinase